MDSGGDKIFLREQRGRKGKNFVPDKSDAAAYIAYLERELELKDQQLVIIKKYIPTWDRTETSRDCICEAIYLCKENGIHINVENICTSNGFHPRIYYKYLIKRHNKIAKKVEDDKIVVVINEILSSKFSSGKGYRQVTMDLCNIKNKTINHKKTLRLMRANGLLSKVRKSKPYAGIAKENKESKIAPNIINREFKYYIPFKKILSDITYLLPNRNLKFYLSAAKDLATGEIVAWNVRQDMKLDLSIDIINELSAKGINDYIFHTDQGVHYTSPQFSKFLVENGGTQSMSRRGKCTDNGPMESFFGHFKDEVDYSNVKSLEEMQSLVKEYMIYYNQQRGQWNRKKMSPVKYRQHLLS